MSGETQDQPSGWTPDLLFLHLQSEVDRVSDSLTREVVGLRTSLERQLGSQKELLHSLLGAQSKMLDERYATQTKALDAAFIVQQTAMATAFSAADKAVQAALLAAEKAVTKAEMASEKRFENVNEFRGQLGDMQSTLISRVEADARFNDLTRQVSDIKSAIDKGFTAVDTKSLTGKDNWGYLVGAIGMLAVIVTMVLALTGK